MEKYEFGSPEWLQLTCDLIERYIEESGVDLTGIDYVSGEAFTNVPARLNPSGAATVGWTLTVRDGKVSTITLPPPDDADTNIVADWDGVERIAQMTGSLDPEDLAARQALSEELTADGRMVRIQRGEPPASLMSAFGPQFLIDCHAFTAPRHA